MDWARATGRKQGQGHVEKVNSPALQPALLGSNKWPHQSRCDQDPSLSFNPVTTCHLCLVGVQATLARLLGVPLTPMIEPSPSLQEESEKQLNQTETQTREVLLMLFPTLSNSTSQVRGGPWVWDPAFRATLWWVTPSEFHCRAIPSGCRTSGRKHRSCCSCKLPQSPHW